MARTLTPAMISRLIGLSGLVATLSGGPAYAACTAGVAAANVAESTPSSDFHGFDDGTVAHLKTGLIWKRCAEGQSWNGAGCDGVPLLLTWSQALQISAQSSDAGAADWRVPNRKELEAIVEPCGHNPAINLAQFPDTPAERFWTSTTFVDTPTSAWDVYFSDGYSGASNKTTERQAVRLVRTAPSGSLLNPQSISFGVPPSLVVGGTGTLAASASSGLPLSFASLTPETCSVSGDVATGLVAGECTIAASQAGDASYYPSVATLALVINKQLQTISFGNAPSLSVGGTATLVATATSGLPVALASATPAVCGLAGSTVSGLATGTCMVVGNQPGDEMFAAAPAASLSFDVGAATADGGDSGDGGSETPRPEVIGYTMRLGAGWHLLGNSLNTPIDVAQRFADRRIVESVWKWISDTQRWAFFTPQFNRQALASYARARGLDVLATIEPGEGYWVKLKQAHDFGEQRGEAAATSLNDLIDGWHLVTVGKTTMPSELNATLAAAAPPDSPPAVSAVPQSFVSLWSWDSAKGRMLFYSPELEAQGPEAVKGYLDAKGFLDFDTEQKPLGEGRGFWIRIKK